MVRTAPLPLAEVGRLRRPGGLALASGLGLGLLLLFPNIEDVLEGDSLEKALQDLAGLFPDLIGSAGGAPVTEIGILHAVDQTAGPFHGF